jgi:hypothetical protein
MVTPKEINMEFKIQVLKDPSYILIKVKGEITNDRAISFVIEANKIGKETGINKYLEDLREARNVDTIINNYNFAYKDINIPEINRNARYALLVDKDDYSHDFIEIVSQNNGFLLKLFRDEEAAIKYLLK